MLNGKTASPKYIDVVIRILEIFLSNYKTLADRLKEKLKEIMMV